MSSKKLFVSYYHAVIERMKVAYRYKSDIPEECRVTIGEMGVTVGVQSQDITNWNRRGVDVNLLANYAMKHNVSVDWLLFGTDPGISGLAERIRQVRIKHVVPPSRQGFGSLLDASEEDVIRWEGGDSVPGAGQLGEISRLGNITLENLLYGRESPRVPPQHPEEKPLLKWCDLDSVQKYLINWVSEHPKESPNVLDYLVSKGTAEFIEPAEIREHQKDIEPLKEEKP
ncbi:MAG: hypothetical protein J3T61_05500 [Candidatus Brocadiales bacterium]|nr:hypothetical protein [Candidatus Bathyanammoxibius sp.]